MTGIREVLLGGLALALGASGAQAQSASGQGAAATAPMISVQMPAPPAPVPVSLKPATTALFVSDVVEPICSRQPEKCVQGMVPKIADLIARARTAGMLVAYSTQEANMEQ